MSALHRRAGAARRLPLLPRQSDVLRDYDRLADVGQPKPSTYGLTDKELRAEVRRLRAQGWTDEEIGQVLAWPTDGEW